MNSVFVSFLLGSIKIGGLEFWKDYLNNDLTIISTNINVVWSESFWSIGHFYNIRAVQTICRSVKDSRLYTQNVFRSSNILASLPCLPYFLFQLTVKLRLSFLSQYKTTRFQLICTVKNRLNILTCTLGTNYNLQRIKRFELKYNYYLYLKPWTCNIVEWSIK